MVDYIAQLPLPVDQIPQGLKDVLTSEDVVNPQREVVVTHRYERNIDQDCYEYLHMLMASVPEEDVSNLSVFDESSDGVVTFSTPDCREKGGEKGRKISVSGYGYIVASWGDGLHYSFYLAEDVWMSLGLRPRLIGDSGQKVIFDNMRLPDFGVAQGDVSSEHHFVSNKDVKWTMRNEYLRRYLWMKGCVGVKVFYYEAYIQRTPEVISLLGGSNHYKFNFPSIDFEIVDHEDRRILLQVWGTVEAVHPELCDRLDIDTLIWPGDTVPMTRQRAADIRLNENVFVDDEFLVKYEKDNSFDAIPYYDGSFFRTAPSYGGQWAFRDCIREGRNLVRIPFYELYRGIPEKEVYHVFDYAKDPKNIDGSEFQSEHIVSKTYRFANELIMLNENLVDLGKIIGVSLSNADIFEYNRQEFKDEGIRNYPVLQRLSYVASRNMQEQDFLSRCKTINEIINKIKVGSLRKLVIAMGVPKKEVEKFQALKLLQAILNLCGAIVEQNEDPSALNHAADFADFKAVNANLAPLFINNDLRNAEAHEAINKSMEHLAKLGFDAATLASGYSCALDFMFDGVIDSLSVINSTINDSLH